VKVKARDVTDDDFAAVLAVAADAGVMPLSRLLAEVDAELAARPEAPMWLINTSLALSLPDAVRALREHVQEHPLFTDPVGRLEVVALAVEVGLAAIERASGEICRLYPYAPLPPDLNALAYDVEEEAQCAHEHNGVPKPDRVDAAILALLRAARGRSAWSTAIEGVIGDSASSSARITTRCT
jgi:hypothetical protein